MDLPLLSFHASLEEQWDEEEEPEETETVLKVVPPLYHQYWDLFSKVKEEKLPPHRACDHHIKLDGAYISENVEKGFIRPSSSSTGAPLLFVKKKNGGLHLCVEYGKLNAVTRKNRYPVPPMNQLLTVFNGSTIFSKIDLCVAYNLLRIKEGNEHLTAFRTKYGSYEYLVMPFCLTNAPASFQKLLNDIFADFLDVFAVVYVDDIMVFSSSEEAHVKYVACVLQRLWPQDLFFKSSANPQLASAQKHQGSSIFSRLCQFCHCFIKNYSKKITSLTSLLKKDSPFIFNEEALSQFQSLKEAFTTAPILSHFNPSLPTI
ncbi:hypothetical protein O181_124491, partial [Austropuccinia psidii MF-1]|nr:hypothetical protein [Austropuccinia psidii MF-1]